MVSIADLIKQIMKVDGDFHNARDKYVIAHPTFSKEKDARLTIYGRIISSLDMALLHLMFRTFQLPYENWWTGLPQEFRNLSISPTINWTPDDANRAKIIDTLDKYWAFSLFILLFATIENSVRAIVRTAYPTEFNDGRGDLTKIYQRLLSTNYTKYETLLKLFRLVRNTSHNNGVYFPPKVGDDHHITFKGSTYDFIDSTPVDLRDVSRLLLFDILPEVLAMIEDIINSPDVSKHNDIVDLGA